jgi:hypothetical protein
MRTVVYYRERAARFRELARDTDDLTAQSLIALAEEHEAEALRSEPNPGLPKPA